MVKRDPNALYCDDVSLAQQHFAAECDINEILRRSQLSGELPVSTKVPQYGDFTAVPKDLHSAFAMIKEATDVFMALDWKIRERFGNDPAKMVDFLNDSANRDEAIKLGLVKALVKPPEGDTPKVAEPAQ